MANNDINFYVIANTSSADAAFQKTYNTAQKIFSKPIKPNIDTNALNKSLQPLGKFSSNFKEFEKSLDAATARVVAFTATTGLIYGLGNAFKRLTSDAIQVEAAVARIQGILKASDEELASFTDSIFKLANNTGQGFYDAAKAAEEFARQGLSLEQTLKATESALILTRLSGTNLQDAMNGLVATVSSFSNELLDYGRVVNTLASIDAKFSTSAAGLVEGIKRVGSVASDAGVSFEELSSSIAAIRQITGRSESVIGNGLKTIFTNLQTEKVQQELAKLGIQTQKSTGEFLPLINVIDQLAAAFQNLNDSQRADLGQKVAGKYQINTFKALIQSFGGKDTSLFDQALQTAKGSQDEAVRRNELLNKTTLSTLNQLNNSITALGASFGDKVGKPLVDTLAKAANQGLEVLTGVFKDNPIGDFITGGIVSALKGPGILLAGVALAKLTKRIVFELTDAVKSVGGLNSRTQQNLKLDEAITNALKNGNAERVKAVNLATTLEEKQRQINALLRESYPSRSKSAQPYLPLATLVDKDTRKQVLKSVGRNAANGIMPAVAKEQSSIYNGVGGARKTARPVIANINMAGGSTPVVVNTDEHIIRNFANTGKDAVFNRNMTRQAGGAQSLGRFGNVEKVMAAGYAPRVKGVTPSILEAPFTPTSGETFGLDPRKLDFIRKITENVTGARTKPVRFRKNLENYGEFWPDSNNVLINPKVISNKSPYYGGYSVPAHEYGHFMEYNSDPALVDLFKSAHKFDIKKRGSLFNQMSKKIGSGAGYSKKNYFSESFADTFAYSFLDRGDREPALGGRAMSDLMRELIMNNIPVKSKANGFVPNFARRSRFQEKDDEFFDLLNGLDLDNIGYTPGTGKGLSDRTIRRGAFKHSFTRFTADRKNRIIKIDDTESFMKGDAFKNYSALADFAKRKDFIIKSAAFVKQGSRDNTKDKGISLLYKLFPQLRYRDGVAKNTSGKYHIGRSERKFSSLHDLKSQVGQLGDSHIRSISKFSDIQDNFAGGVIPNFAMPKSKRDIKADRKKKMVDFYISKRGTDFLKYDDLDGYYNKSNIQDIRQRNSSYETIKHDNYINRSVLDNINYNVNPKFIDTNYIGSDKREFLNNFIERGKNPGVVRETVLHNAYRPRKAGPNVRNFLEQKSQKAQDFLYAIETKLALADLGGVKKITTKDGSEVDLTGFFDDESLMDLGSRTDGYIKKTSEKFKKRYKEFKPNPTLRERLRAFKKKRAGTPLPSEPYLPPGRRKYLKEKLLGQGAFGAFFKLKGNVGVKRFLNPSNVISESEIRYEYPIAKALADHPKLLPGLHAPKVYGSLEKAAAKLRIGKEVVDGRTFDRTFDRNELNEGEYSVIRNIVSRSIGKIGMRASDLHSGNLMVNEQGIKLLNRYRKLLNPDYEGSKLIRDENFDTIASAFARRGGRISLIDPGLFMQSESGIIPNPDYGKLKDKLATKRDSNYANGIIPNFAIDKSVYRHYYKQLKRKLRSSKATYDLSGYGFWDHMGKSNKSTTLYRGTDYQEVEKLLNDGKFNSNWTDGSKGYGTFVSSSINYGTQYAREGHRRSGAGYMLALNKNIAGKDRERSVQHAMGNVATNMAISGDVLDSDVRAILQYDETKKGRLRPLPLGDLILKDTKAFKGSVPNFANPLKDSISREYDALSDMGYPSYVAKNSIKVGSHDRLKSDNNPNGLGVYNTAQGQMSLGQALGQHAGQSLSSGIVPNFADLKTSTEKVSSKNLGLLIISTKRLSNSFSYLGDYLSTSFLSSIRKTTGSIIDISDAANTKYKGIIDPTNIPSNKKAALVDPTGQAYGQSETARRLGLPIPTPVSQGGISSNIVGLPSSLKSGKSVNYKDFKDTPISSTLLSLDVASERKREAEAKRKSDKAVNEYIQNGINKSSPYGGKISPIQQKIRFTPNDISKTVKKLGLPVPTPIVKGGISSPIAELPPSLRDGTRQAGNIQIPTTQTTIERLGLPAPTPVKNNPPVVLKPQSSIRKPLSYQELANAQLPPTAIGLNLDVDAERKREANLLKENNDAIEEDRKARIEAQKQRDEAYEKSEKAEANREKNRNQYEKDKTSREKQFAKDKRIRGRKGQIESIIEGRVSNLQFGGPEQNLKSLAERAEKSLGKEGASKIEKRFKNKEAKAFEAFSAQSGFFTSDKKLKSIAKKLNISTSSQEFLEKKERIRSNRQTAVQTGAFALPFVAGGIANTFGGQETSGGRITSGIGEAAGTALLLSQFGPLGTAAGVAVGSFQILSTVVKELTPDLNQLSKKSREVTAANEKEISSLQAFVQTSSQLKSLIDSNSSPSTVAQAKIALSESTRGLSGDSGMRLLKASTDEERTSIIQDVTLSNQRKQSLVDANLITGSIVKEKASGMYSNIDRIGFNTREFLDTGNVQSIASELVKTIDLSKISNEAVSKAKTGKASLKDLGLDNAEVGKVFDDINKFFNNGSKSQTGASEGVLKFVQSLVVAQKSLDELSSQQIDTAKIFASTKDSFLNILTSTFAQNQSVNKNIISGNEIGFSNAEAILAKSSESLSPEELLKGSTRIKQARIGQQTAIEKTSLGNEYTNKVLEDIMSQASGTSLDDQIKIQDVLNKSTTGESPFDPLKLTDEIQKILDPDASKSLQSQLLKTNIEMASKLQDIDNKSKEASEELKNQTEIQQKQLADTKLLNILGGFNSNFRDVLRSIKQPKGGLTTTARGEEANNFQFGEISNIGSAKPGSMDAVDKSQRNIEIATNRASYFSDIELPKTTRDKLNERNYKDLYLAGKSNVENRALAFGQSEILPQFDILKTKIAGKDTGSIGRKAIDRQLESVKKSFDLGQIPVITEDFVKTIQSLMPQANKDGSMQRALDVIIDETGIVQEVFLSAEKSAKVLADKTIKGEKLSPEFDAQIDAIGGNTTILLQNTLSLDALQTVLSDLPSKIADLRTKSGDQVKAFDISNQIQTLQADTAFKTTNLQKSTDAGAILRSVITQADTTKTDAKSIEDITSLGLTRLFPSMSSSNNPLSLFGAGSDMSGKQMQDFLKFENQPKIPSSPSEIDDALKTYIANSFPSFTQGQRDETFKKYSDDAAYKQLTSATSKDSGLFEGGVERNRNVLNADILNNTKKIEELARKLEELNSNTKVQSNDTTQVAPTTTQTAPTVNISFNGVGSVDPNKVKEAVYSALANINRENNLPPPIQRPVSNTLVA